MLMNNNILNMINEYIEAGDFSGEVSDEILTKTENTLKVMFPTDYKEFIKRFGSGGICGVDILGVEREDYASVVEYTIRYRKLGLPSNYIVIEDVDEFLYCLNTVEEYYVIRWDDISKKEIKRYKSFTDYLDDSFQEAIDNVD